MAGSAVPIFSLIVFFYFGIGNILAVDAAYEKNRIRTSVAKIEVFEHGVLAEGKIVAMVEPTVFAASDGYISLYVKPGDSISKGQVLAKIDSPQLEAELIQVNSQLEKTQNRLKHLKLDVKLKTLESEQALKVAKIRYEAAKRKLERYNTPQARQAFSQQELESVEDNLLILKAEYDNLNSTTQLLIDKLAFEVRSAELELISQEVRTKDLQRQVDELTIKSTIDGQVGNIYVNEKDSVSSRQALMKVIDLSTYGVEMDVPESYANDLDVGMNVEISYEDKTYRGELTTISAEVSNNSIEARAKFVDVPAGNLRQNQRVSIKVLISSIPNTLVVRRGPFIDSGGGRTVYVVNGDVAEARSVRIGEISVAQVEILEGLRPGEKIIISDTSMFNNSEKVLLR